MTDKITLQRIELLLPSLVAEGKAIYAEICEALKGRAICRYPYTLRTNAQQAEIYAQGRTKPGKVVTWAKPGYSWHNYGMAIDIVLLKDTNGDGTFETASWETNVDFDGDGKADWMEVVAIFEKYGWEWGGRWPKGKTDNPHFQKTLGKTIDQVRLAKKESKGYPIFG
jgi:peptidoglycan LD-endopeptidase CwlK